MPCKTYWTSYSSYKDYLELSPEDEIIKDAANASKSLALQTTFSSVFCGISVVGLTVFVLSVNLKDLKRKREGTKKQIKVQELEKDGK